MKRYYSTISLWFLVLDLIFSLKIQNNIVLPQQIPVSLSYDYVYNINRNIMGYILIRMFYLLRHFCFSNMLL